MAMGPMALKHREYSGLYTAIPIAIIISTTVGGLFSSREAGQMIFKVACLSCATVALMIILIIGMCEGVAFCYEKLVKNIAGRYWPQLLSESQPSSSD